jgi:hypothetical protein
VNSPSNKPRNRFADPQNPEADLNRIGFVREGEKQTQEEEITRRRPQTNEEKMDGKTNKQTNKQTAERKVAYRNNTQFFKSPESNKDDISGLKFSRKKISAESKSRERKKKEKGKTPKFSSNSQENNNNLKHKIGCTQNWFPPPATTKQNKTWKRSNTELEDPKERKKELQIL